MKSKHLLLTLLLALFVPWAANAQTRSTLTVYENATGTNTYLPIFGNWADVDQHHQMIYPSTVLSAIGEGATISKMVFYTNAWSSYKDIDDLGTWTVKLGETTATTLSALDESTTLTEVFSDVLVCNDDHTTITIDFTTNYTYNGGNLLVDITHEGADYINITFLGTSDATSASFYQYDYYGTWTGGTQNFLPRVTITHQGGTINPCQAPTLAEAVLTPGNGNVASLSWTENGESTSWVLQTATNNDFTENLQSYNIIGTPTKDLNSLTAEQTYYARVKPTCEGDKWSNPVSFTPTAALSICEDFEGYTATAYDVEGVTPLGWDVIFTGTNNSYSPHVATGIYNDYTIHEGNGFCFTSGSADYGSNNYAILPAIEGATIKSISFKYRYESTSNGTLTMGYITDKNDANTYTPLETVAKSSSQSSSASYDLLNSDLTSKIPDDARIAFCWSHSSSYYTCGIDDVCVYYLPNPTPKPKNLHVVDGTLWSGGATLAWDAPASATPTSYQYRYTTTQGVTWTAWESTTELSVELNLQASTNHTFEVRAVYAEGESAAIETSFRTLDNCAYPTNLTATTTPGQGTKATLTWVKGYDEIAWVLQLATDNQFTEGLIEITDGFTVEGNLVTYNAASLTAETQYYARVKANCDGPTSEWSNVAIFTPSYYVDYTYGTTASTTNSYIPFYGYYADDSRTVSQYIIPATELVNIAGGNIRSLTYYTTSTPDWGSATVNVYVKEVNRTTFTSSESSVEDWTTMTQVYNGSLTVSDGQMTIPFAQPYNYAGGNLMIGIKMDVAGTSSSVSWTSVYNSSSSSGLYGYWYEGWSSSYMSYSTSYYYPKTTINYLPTSTPRPIITEPVATTDVTATVAWTKPSDNVTGYKYQYKLASATEWPTAWTSLGADAVSVTVPNLTPNTSYDFQIKAVYAEGESVASSTSFATACPVATPVPYTYGFETAPEFNCWEVTSSVSNGVRRTNSYAHVGNYSLVFYGTQLNEIEMPLFNQPTNTLRLEYWVRPEGYTDSRSGSFAIGYYNANDEFVALKTYEFNTTTNKYDDWESTVYIKQSIDFDVDADNDGTPDVPADAHIVFRQFNPTSNYYWMVDDVKVKVIPTCADVNDVHYVSFTNHSATIAWTAEAAQTAWQIAYKAGANFNPYNADELATATVVDVTSNPYLFDKNLEAATTYYMYVRGNCTASSNGYGDWSDSYATFTTKAATPAPTNFTASNIGSSQADLVWNAGGGDYETSWELYYVETETAPTAPDATTHPTKTVETLPTPESPYVLRGLTAEKTYYIWVRADHGNDGYSVWTALTGNYFVTPDACPTPADLTANNLTAVSADLSWTGSPDVTDYTVQYRTAAQIDPDNIAYQEHFTSQSLPTGWTRYSTLLTDDVLNGTTALTSTTSGWGYNSYALGSYNWKVNLWNTGVKYWMVTPSIEVGVDNVLSFKTALTDYNDDNITGYPGTSSKFIVLISSDEMATWTVLREWNNTGSNYVLNDIPTTGASFTIDLSSYKEKSVNIAFYAEQTVSGTDNDLHIDDVVVARSIPAGQWVTATDNVTTQSYRLNNLTGGIKYDAHVKSNCTSGEYCPEVSFTTLAVGTKVFTNATGDNMWGTGDNWMPYGMPSANNGEPQNDVVIRDNAIIAANTNGPVTANAKTITFQGTPTPTLTIDNGCQLVTNSNVNAIVKKDIVGYGTGNEASRDRYYLIANPLNSTIYSYNLSSTGLLTGKYDLYSWSYSATDGNEWRNYETSTFSLANGTGYLYANENDVTLTFNGTVMANNTPVQKTANYAESSNNYDFNGWNLFGNPFVCDAYITDESSEEMGFYRMVGAGNTFEAVAGGAVRPMEGIFVKATAASQTFKFSRLAADAKSGKLNMNLSSCDKQVDNAIVRFGQGNMLEKFSFNANSSKIYIPVEGKNYAIANAESNVGEIPFSFEAKSNGTYTLSFTNEEVSFAYLHLIDNMTGIETDLLQTPSYSFDARTTDYTSRFKLVFATGNNSNDENFAYYSNGNWVINNEGRATLQVVDVNGRILKSETINGCTNVNFNAAAGVYMIRLVNGDNVKVQKVVVR